VNTLEALAYKFADTTNTVVPMIDARRGEVYLAGYRFVEGEMREQLPPCLVKVAETAPLLARFTGKVLVGSGAERHSGLLRDIFPDSLILHRSHFLASEVGKVAWQRFQRRQFITDLQELLPVYIRRPDAETRLVKTDGAPD
jgi:tRNA threonylcarbamoyladenosine biosynthesis protein TsaB